MADKLQKNPYIAKRSYWLIAICMLLFCCVLGRLFFLQVISYEEYQNKVIDNTQAEATVTADRGVIYDSSGVKLATNYTVYRVFISPRDIMTEEEASAKAAQEAKTDRNPENDNMKAIDYSELIAHGLAELLGESHGVTYEKVAKEISMTKYRDRTIAKNVEDSIASRVLQFIEANGLSTQVHLETTTKRYYPYGSLAAHVLGFVGTDGGLLGLELQYNSYLTGIPGRYVTAQDAFGVSLSQKYETYIEAQDGASLITTLDMTLQHILENQLKQTFADSDPLNRVTGIAMDVNTGGVLAMATYPDFDLNSPFVLDELSQTALDALMLDPSTSEYNEAFYTAVYKMWNNKAVNDLYEPGSTFKPMTTAMALSEGVLNWSDEFECKGYHVVAGQSIKCHKTAGHGLVTYAVGLQQSCNPCLMQAAERVGREKFYDYFRAFGYTEKTGIDLPGEANSLYHEFSAFGPVELAVSSFGQTFKSTAIQHLSAICAIANGGYLMKPHVVSQVVDANGNVVLTNENQVKRQVISSSICEAITRVLEEGVSGDGGARNAYVPGYKIAAKTGTSEVTDIRDEEGNTYLRVGSCMAYAPADDPQIAVIIIVDQPQCENIYGSYVAAPYVANFMGEALAYLGIEREYSDDELANLTTTLRNYVGLSITEVTNDLTNRGITFTVKGNGDTLTYQIPAGGSTISKSTGHVMLYCGDEKPDKFVTVPNLTGYRPDRANAEITNMGLNLVMDGTTADGAVVVSQDPAPGTSVELGSVVTITLRHLNLTD